MTYNPVSSPCHFLCPLIDFSSLSILYSCKDGRGPSNQKMKLKITVMGDFWTRFDVLCCEDTFLLLLQDGYVFRVKIGHYREMVLLQQRKEFGTLKHLYEANAKILEREIVHLPLLSSIIHG